MVLIEEVHEEPHIAEAKKLDTNSAVSTAKTSATMLKKGFLGEAKETLYPAEGSPEGVVKPETHKAHAENKLNKEINQGMNRGAEANNGIERPPWYTKEWPKDCQYNSPGCYLEELEASAHATAVHKEMARGSRWQEALQPGLARMGLAFNQLTDEDMTEIIESLKGNKDVTELDLSNNHFKDAGIQRLVGALAGGAAPNLKELRIHSNEFSDLGKVMLTQGLKVLRKKLEIHWDEPSWLKDLKQEKAKANEKEQAQTRLFDNELD